MSAPSKSELDPQLLAILHRVASGEVPGVALGTTNAGAAFRRLEMLITKHNLNKQIMLRASMSPNEIYILNKEQRDDA